MIPVEGIIGDLLLQHNCVIVPAFGGFVAKRIGAQLDTINGTITPPRKSVLFNRQLINNDGLLIASFAAENGTDYSAAQHAINDAVATWEQDLRNGQRVSIDRVGFLYLDAERNLCFEQDRFYNLLMESYGLGTIHFVSATDVEAKATRSAVQEVVREAIQEAEPKAIPTPLAERHIEPVEINFTAKSVDVVEEAPVSSEVHEVPLVVLPAAQKKPNRTWRYVAAAALLPLGFYSFWIPMKTDVLESGVLTLNDFNPFKPAAAATYQPSKSVYSEKSPNITRQLETIPETGEVYSYSIDGNVYIPVKLREAQEAVTVEEPSAPEPAPAKAVASPTTPKTSKKQSHIIVGVFNTEKTASDLMTSLSAKGYDASILPGPNGSFRVSAGNGKDFKVLNAKLQAEGLSAWVLQ